MMKILVACEESQAVTKEFRRLGHEAYSCDIEPCSGGHPEWHIQGDVAELINGYRYFFTCDNTPHRINAPWDMIIAFPPCTHLAVSGAAYFKNKREDGRQRKAIEFFMEIMNADCDKVSVENPVNIISGKYIKKWFPDLFEKYKLPIKPSQIIQPYEYGHPESKKTCLWLKGLPKLQPTNILPLPDCGYWQNQTKDKQNKLLLDGVWIAFNDSRTPKLRSKTYQGIAKAMAEQWGN